MAEFHTPRRVERVVRHLMDDTVEPYFVSEELLLDFMNLRMREAAKASLCRFESGSRQYNAKRNHPWIPVDEQVIKMRALVGEDGRLLKPLAVSEAPDWSKPPMRDPDSVLLDVDQFRWRLYPTPVKDEVLTFAGWVYPIALENLDCPFGMPDYALEDLHMGVLASCFGIADKEEMYDPKKEAQYEKRWYAALDRLQSYQVRDQRSSGGRVRYGGY